jgi:hypothetical protein
MDRNLQKYANIGITAASGMSCKPNNPDLGMAASRGSKNDTKGGALEPGMT